MTVSMGLRPLLGEPKWGRSIGARWGDDYNRHRPHSALARQFQKAGTDRVPAFVVSEARRLGDHRAVAALFLGAIERGVGTTFFRTDVSNWITYINDPKYVVAGANPNGSHYVNLTSMRSEGFENTATLRPSREVTVVGTHTYAQARDNSTGSVIQRSPHNTGSVRVTYTPDEVEGLSVWGKVRAASWSKSSTTTWVHGYSVADFGVGYELTDWAKIYGRVENLFDHHYYTASPGYATEGRAGFVGLTMNF
jgi:outer membrane cobalamin receptor